MNSTTQNKDAGGKQVVVDATGLVLGRMATSVAKQLMAGHEIVIINAEKAIIAGNRAAIFSHYRERRALGDERKGPYFPRMPDRILRRTVRGMLPYRRTSGKAALKRLHVYVGVPEPYADAKAKTVDNAKKPHLREYVELGEVSKNLGAAF